MKICSKCGEEKPLEKFYKRATSKDGRAYSCKECNYEYKKIYGIKNKKTLRKKAKKYYQKRKDKVKLYQEKNAEKIKKYRKMYYEKNKDKIKSKVKTYRDNNKDKINAAQKKSAKNKAPYITYKNKLTIDENPKLACDGVSLAVKCKYCGKYFIPTAIQVNSRVQALNGNAPGEQNLYCSSGCKKACPTFGQREHYKGQKVDGSSREVQPQLRQMRLERDNYTCQKCGAKGKTVQLHCHHIKAVIDDPIESADVDNTITLCKSCHKEVHKIPGCRYHELRCAK